MDKKEKYSIVIKCTRTGADCECCGTYDARCTDLDCGHQLDRDEYKVGEKVRCPECNGDYDV